MAIETRRYYDSGLRWPVGLAGAKHRSGMSALRSQTVVAAQEILPWLVAVVLATLPFILYAMGQARLGAAMNRRTALLRQISSDRVEITQIRDHLRVTASQAALVKWAEHHDMKPASEVIALGVNLRTADRRTVGDADSEPSESPAVQRRGGGATAR